MGCGGAGDDRFRFRVFLASVVGWPGRSSSAFWRCSWPGFPGKGRGSWRRHSQRFGLLRRPSRAGQACLQQSDDALSESDIDARALRLTARRTWRFFENFVTPADHMLPPDNFQEDPTPALAHRTSPTNLGLYLLSIVSARDFGWMGTIEAIERLEATLATMGGLERFRGHFYNWYDTRDWSERYDARAPALDLPGNCPAVACDLPALRSFRKTARSGARSAAGREHRCQISTARHFLWRQAFRRAMAAKQLKALRMALLESTFLARKARRRRTPKRQ